MNKYKQIKKKLLTPAALLAVTVGMMQSTARATDAALITAVEDAIEAAGTGLSTILIAVIAIVGSFVLFKLIKRGANKV